MSCVDEIMEAARKAGVTFLPEEAEEIVAQLENALAKRVAKAGQEEFVDLVKLAKQMAIQARINAAIIKKSRLLNARAYKNIMIKVSKAAQKAKASGKKFNPTQVLSGILVGDVRTLEAGLYSIDTKQQAISYDYLGTMLASLRKKELDDIFISGELDELIYKSMFDGPNSLDVTKHGKDAVESANQIASIIKSVQKKILNRKNRAGAVVNFLENYVVRQGHDPILMRKAGKTEWVNYMLEKNADGTYKRLDMKTFESKNALKDNVEYTEADFMGDIYDNLVTGIHEKSDGTGMSGSDKLTAFTGPANLAKKLSTSRVIHFKDGKSAFDYSKKFNRMSLSESVTSGIMHDGQSIGLMETMGTNPKAMFDRVLQDVQKTFKEDVKIIESLNTVRLQNQFKELDGTSQARGSGKMLFNTVDFAGIAAAWRMLQNMAKLGMATISSFSDIATKAHFIHTRTERGLFSSYAKAFSDIFSTLGTSKEKKQLAFLLNVGIDNFLGDVHARFGTNDSFPGTIGKAHQLFFRLNGMTWWNNAQKVGLARMLSADLASYSGKSFDQIPTNTRLNLTRYGIDELDWKILSNMEQVAVDGNKYITSSGIDTISSDLIEQGALRKANLTRKRKLKKVTDVEIERYKDELRTKMASYFTDAADSAIPTPGAKERAMMNMGTQRGTIVGEAIRAIMQLKGFPITYITKGMTHNFHIRQQAGKSGIIGLSQMMIGTTVMGYLSMSLKDILKGKSPAEVFDEDNGLNFKTFQRAFLQGGGAGIYGDFVLGEFNRFGQSPLETFAGPTFGLANDTLKLAAKIRDGKVDATTTGAFRILVSNTPFANLFYTKAALDYFFIYGIMEHTNPGYLRRMERRIKKDTGQTYYLPPSETAIRF